MESDILFSKRKVGDYEVDAWGLGELQKLVPVFERFVVKMATNKLTLKDFDPDVLQKNPGKLFKILPTALPEIAEILSITLNRPTDEINKLKLDQVIELLIVIFQQNVEYLKNSFPLLLVNLQKVMK